MEDVEDLYERWELIQQLLVDIDPELKYAAVEKVELSPNVLAVTFTRLTNQGYHETIVRRYKFAQRP